MKSTQPLPIPPWDPDSRYPRRHYRFKIDDVVGWSEFHVLAQLGPPNEKRVGAEWQDGPTARDVLVRIPSGTVMRAACFGPVPRKIPPLQAYEAWYYHNVRGMTWILYLTRTSRIPILNWFLPRIVVEVYAHPTNAVF